MQSQLIAINAGSSSIKFALFAAGGSLQRLTEGQIDRIGSPAASITVRSNTEAMVNSQAGMLGVSETSADMRDLLEREATDARAAEAVALFCYQVKKWIGGFAAALGGLDTLIFTGGIGENAPVIRARICEGLGFLGIELSPSRNAETAGVISTDASRAAVRVIHTDEELMIARSVLRFCPEAGTDQVL